MNQRTPFHKILIANRGEIARRIMRTARRLGHGVVAVYSDADADTPHVREADQAVRIGEALPAQSYLRIEAIVAAARASGADAIHPGYGFLAENAGLAQACRDAGLVFVGPSPEAIRAMGNKASAKQIMQAAGVPCVPGYQGADQSDAAMLIEAGKIGYPVMIKAVAGGGGRGMRLVADAASFPDALRSARSEAASAFGDPTVILERAIVDPRHIEIQVFGDRHGSAVHLGERDCSVQRRHQKLIEEAPSPAVSPELRARMGAVAVKAVQSIGYEGAGTLEFLLDRNGAFYFMEMNTRLQVEHPVTEAITGLDLVELQLRVAGGEPLGLTQNDITFSGHAIEVRLCSEDVNHDFMPQSGRMALWQVPEGIRVEHALQSGSEISPFYDSMIAKLISHGSTRDEARGKLICGLEQTMAFGVTTNQALLIACLRHPAFAAGEATTAFIYRYGDELRAPGEAARAPHAALAALLLDVTDPHAPPWRAGRTLAATFPRPVRLEIDRGIHDLEVVREREGGYAADIGGEVYRFEVDELEPDTIRFRSQDVMESASFFRDRDRLYFQYRGIPVAAHNLTLAAPATAAATAGDGKVRAAMNGRVVAVLVKPGERVEAGQPVMTLEAMKMEHVHAASISGTISAIDVSEGEQVTTGKVVVVIEASSPSFRGARSASPESILPIVVMDSGPAPRGASRNDEG
jgi:geranyl-CoA carboxylase alpha subunit